MHLEDLIQRIDQLIRNADEVIQTEESVDFRSYVNEELFSRLSVRPLFRFSP